MILEIADIRVKPGSEAAFEEAIGRALATVMSRAKGAGPWKVHRCVETPQRYVLEVEWDSIEAHTVDFRGGPLFAEWRAIIGPFFASPPLVEHFGVVHVK